MNRQKQILCVLLIVLGLTSLYAYFSSTSQSELTSTGDSVSTRTTSRSGSAETPKVSSNLQVNLELLDLEKKKYNGYKRDLFNYYQPRPKPSPIAKQTPRPEPVARPIPVAKPTPVVTPQVRKQLASFTFLGFLVKDEERTVFLSKRDELFLVKKGEFFGENSEFEVTNVTADKLTITQQGASGQIEIPLVEKEPLIPSFSAVEPSGPTPIYSVDEAESPEAPNRDQVPLQEQRKRWFKNTQPPVDEKVTE